MSISDLSLSDRARAKRLRAQSAKDLTSAKRSARKAVDLKDPRFLGEAAVAASRGPVGLALFAAKKGVEVGHERAATDVRTRVETGRRHVGALATASRREPAEYVKANSGATRKGKAAAKRELKRLRRSERSALRRFAPLWGTALVGGVAVAGGTAYFLRGSAETTPSRSTSPSPASPDAGRPAGTAAGTTAAGTAATGTATVHTADPDASSTQQDSSAATSATGGRHELRDEGSTSPVDRYAAEGAAAATPADAATPKGTDHTPTTPAATGGLATGSTDDTNDPGAPKRA